MRNLLLGAVEKGTGKEAKIESLAIGGKTGTSKVIVEGKYSNSNYYSSFIGFYPANNPSMVCYVLIHKPKGQYYGGLVSAPVFKNILARIYELERGNYDRPKPNTDIKIADNKNQGTNNDFVQYDLQSDENLSESGNVFITDNNRNIMPDLRGKTIKEALVILNDLGIKWSISGSGVITEQSIPAGQVFSKRKTCLLTCSQIGTTGTRIY
jgi:cell division protein FtsI (penicillin-binding protein 3)